MFADRLVPDRHPGRWCRDETFGGKRQAFWQDMGVAGTAFRAARYQGEATGANREKDGALCS